MNFPSCFLTRSLKCGSLFPMHNLDPSSSERTLITSSTLNSLVGTASNKGHWCALAYFLSTDRNHEPSCEIVNMKVKSAVILGGTRTSLDSASLLILDTSEHTHAFSGTLNQPTMKGHYVTCPDRNLDNQLLWCMHEDMKRNTDHHFQVHWCRNAGLKKGLHWYRHVRIEREVHN